jgi:hypothetical protein
MPPEDRESRARAVMDTNALQSVRQSPRQSVPPAPADLDMVESAFEGEVYRYSSEWMGHHKATLSNARPFAIVLSRSIQQDEKILADAGVSGFQRIHAFRSQAMLDPEGCLVFATMNLEHAILVPIPNAKVAQPFFDLISTLGVDSRIVALFEPPQANLILMRQGLNGPSRKQAVVESGGVTPWTLQQLEAEVSQFHDDFTRTPSGVLVPWSDAGKGVTGEKLEIRISKNLAYHLDQKWKRGSVLAESETQSGRMDIYITRPVLIPGSGPCVIEVKVFRSRHGQAGSTGTSGRYRKISPKVTEWWGKKGAVQADVYRQDKGAGSAYLCCFDAREKDEEVKAVQTLSKSLNVEYRRYFMYRNTGNLYDAKLAKA